MQYDQFTREQVFFLTFAAACNNMAFNSASWAATVSGRSSWVVLAIGVSLSIPFALLILYLCRDYPGYTIFDIIEKGLGKIMFCLMFFLYCIVTIASATFMLNLFAGLIKLYFLQLTPSWIVMIFIIIISFLLLNNKILLFGRAIEFFTIWYIINYFTGFSFSFFKLFKLENITPIFDTSLLKFGEGVFFAFGASSETLLLVMVMAGNISEPFKHKMWIINGIALWSSIVSLAVFIMQGISGSNLLASIAGSGLGVSRSIYFGSFFNGLEIFVLATYQLICITKISIYSYGIWIPIKKRFKTKYSTIILVLIELLILIPSIWLNSFNDAYYYSIFTSYFIYLPFVIIVILFAYLSVFILKKKAGSGIK